MLFDGTRDDSTLTTDNKKHTSKRKKNQRVVLIVFYLKRKRKGKKKELKSLLGLLNARMKRVEGPELHVKRSRSHKMEKERRIPQNPLIKRWILREFDMSEGVKEGGEYGVDGLLQIVFVDFVGASVT